jgi:hypothetical protein
MFLGVPVVPWELPISCAYRLRKRTRFLARMPSGISHPTLKPPVRKLDDDVAVKPRC